MNETDEGLKGCGGSEAARETQVTLPEEAVQKVFRPRPRAFVRSHRFRVLVAERWIDCMRVEPGGSLGSLRLMRAMSWEKQEQSSGEKFVDLLKPAGGSFGKLSVVMFDEARGLERVLSYGYLEVQGVPLVLLDAMSDGFALEAVDLLHCSLLDDCLRRKDPSLPSPLQSVEEGWRSVVAALGGRWIPLKATSPSGKQQWSCCICGRTSSTPDRHCNPRAFEPTWIHGEEPVNCWKLEQSALIARG